MTKVPNFSKIELDQTTGMSGKEMDQPASLDVEQRNGQSWETAEKISINDYYTHKDTENLDFLNGWPGLAPFLRGPHATMYKTRLTVEILKMVKEEFLLRLT